MGVLKGHRMSVLAARFGKHEAALADLHPEDWLVWEPGTWHAPARSGHTLIGPAPSPLLLAQKEPTAFPLSRSLEVVVGRSPRSTLAINDGTLSLSHLSLSFAEGRWSIQDLGSSNGTKVDGTRLVPGKPLPLASGARISAGRVELTFHDSDGMHQRLQKLLAEV